MASRMEVFSVSEPRFNIYWDLKKVVCDQFWHRAESKIGSKVGYATPKIQLIFLPIIRYFKGFLGKK